MKNMVYGTDGAFSKSSPMFIGTPFHYAIWQKSYTLSTAREWDSESSTYYYRTRYYTPVAGRFNQRDQIEYSGGLNLYSYVGSNPVDLIDPTGMQGDSYTNCSSECSPPCRYINGISCPSGYSIKGTAVDKYNYRVMCCCPNELPTIKPGCDVGTPNAPIQPTPPSMCPPPDRIASSCAQDEVEKFFLRSEGKWCCSPKAPKITPTRPPIIPDPSLNPFFHYTSAPHCPAWQYYMIYQCMLYYFEWGYDDWKECARAMFYCDDPRHRK